MNQLLEPRYPLAAFHLLVQNAAEEVCQNVQAPEALIGTAFLTTLSVACQGLIDIRLPTDQVRPVSLSVMAIAESGERKSAVDSKVSAPIYNYDQLLVRQFENDKIQYAIDHRFWKAADAGIRRQITKKAQNEEPLDGIYQQLKEHGAKEPVKPRLRSIMRHSITERAIIDALHGDGESIALMSDEGEIILKSGAMEHMGLLNKAWDGAQVLKLDRAGGKSFHAHNPRMTTSYMVQRAVIKKFFERNGDVARGSGHWARYLFAAPASTQGTRLMPYAKPEEKYLPKFHLRVTELLEEYGRRIKTGKCQRNILEFSDEARVKWINSINFIEGELRPWGYLHDIKDFASKSMEISARVAALLHWFSEQEGKISLDTLERALKIVGWHLEEFKRIFSPTPEVPQLQVDVKTLGCYLQSQYAQMGYAPKNDVLRNGPLRPSHRLEAAIDHLVLLGHVWIQADSKRKRFIGLNPNFFGFNSLYAAFICSPQLGTDPGF